jgi:hypothetical protein
MVGAAARRDKTSRMLDFGRLSRWVVPRLGYSTVPDAGFGLDALSCGQAVRPIRGLVGHHTYGLMTANGRPWRARRGINRAYLRVSPHRAIGRHLQSLDKLSNHHRGHHAWQQPARSQLPVEVSQAVEKDPGAGEDDWHHRHKVEHPNRSAE